LVEALKGQELFGHVLLTKTERSPLSELAAKFL
jgi:PhoH-like ATPase